MNLLSSLNSIVFTSLLDSDLCPELEGSRKKDQIEEDEVMIYLKTIREVLFFSSCASWILWIFIVSFE
jgi:hypothetical protein